MKYLKALAIMLFVVNMFYACTYKKAEDPVVKQEQVMDTTTARYTRDIKPILVTYCLGIGDQHCHVTNSNIGSNGDYTAYAGLKAKVDNGSLIRRVFTIGGGMPPTYSTGPQTLSDADYAKFKKWVLAGGPNN